MTFERPKAYVYFVKPIGMDGPIKIGRSTLPDQRLVSLLAWCPFPLELLAQVPGDYALEKNVHECFADAHLHAEWFSPTPALASRTDRLSDE